MHATALFLFVVTLLLLDVVAAKTTKHVTPHPTPHTTHAPTPKPKPPKVPGAHVGTVLGHAPRIKHEGNGKSGIVQNVLEKLHKIGPQKRKHLERIFWHLANSSIENAHQDIDSSTRERSAKDSYSGSDASSWAGFDADAHARRVPIFNAAEASGAILAEHFGQLIVSTTTCGSGTVDDKAVCNIAYKCAMCHAITTEWKKLHLNETLCGGIIRQLNHEGVENHHFGGHLERPLLKAVAAAQKSLALLGQSRNEYDVACYHHHNEDYICKQKIACALSYNFAKQNPNFLELVRCPYGQWKRNDDEDDEDYFERLGIDRPRYSESTLSRIHGPKQRQRDDSHGDEAKKLYLHQRNDGPNGIYDQSAHGQFWDESDVASAWSRAEGDDDDDDSRKRNAPHHDHHRERSGDDDRSPINNGWLNGDDWESRRHRSDDERRDAAYYHIELPGGLHASSSDLQTWRSNRHGDHNRHRHRGSRRGDRSGDESDDRSD